MNKLHQNISPQTLGVARAWIFGIWFVKVLFSPIQLLAELPISLLNPVGVLSWVVNHEWVWNQDVFYGFKIALLVVTALAIVGVKPYRAVAISAFILLVLYEGLLRSFSYVNHAQLALLWVTFVICLFPAADGFSVQKRKQKTPETYVAAMWTMTAVFLFSYTIIAAFRIAQGWPDVFFEDTMRHWITLHSYKCPTCVWNIGKWAVGFPVLINLLQLSFPFVTILELLAPLCLFWRKFRYIFVVFAVSFHIFNYLFMNILFLENILLVPVLLMDINPLVAKIRQSPHLLRFTQKNPAEI